MKPEPIRFLHRPDCSAGASCLYAIANPDGTATLTIPQATWDGFIAEVRAGG